MTFDISKFHSIFEAASDETSTASNNTEIDIDMQKPLPAEHNDETGANLDNTLGDADLLSLFDDICPISGDVFAAMKNAAKDPKNLKITMVKSGDGDESKLFVEATEFANYVEASGLTIGEAAEEIIDTYKEDIPEMDNAEVHVVFPSDSLNKNILGSEEYGVDTKNTWPMQLIRGCRRYGLKVNVADDESKKKDFLSENDDLLTESLKEDMSERRAAGPKIRRALNSWLQAFNDAWKDMTFRERWKASKYEKDMADGSADIKFTMDDRDFVNGDSDDIYFKVGSKYNWINWIAVFVGGYCEIGRKKFDQSVMGEHYRKSQHEIEEKLSKDTGYDCTIRMSEKNKAVIVTCKDKDDKKYKYDHLGDGVYFAHK